MATLYPPTVLVLLVLLVASSACDGDTAEDAGTPADAARDSDTGAGVPCPGEDNARGWRSDTEVAIGPGIVRGDTVAALGEHSVTRFRGIPFAESTAGPNRFRPPVPRRCLVDAPADIFEANAWPNICRQTDADGVSVGSEDCLGLNIWAPSQSAAGDAQPVIVWLHGGGMWYGNAQTDMLPGPHLASAGAVMVSMHSRVGPLGYVAHSAFEEESPTGSAAGNYGVMDVIEGLRWIRDNIDAFGGDPDNVTVIGVSGGGDRVYYLMASPLAAGLFHRAAPHAGSTWVVSEPARVERAATTMV
ncbi:MAG: carboxylesterase family protein [Deltaproteobacteria bacterium]|nr:carboxylesterase family protein [Deltaproteobacteria bacterium]